MSTGNKVTEQYPRRNSTAEERRSLIQKYNNELQVNKSEISYNDSPDKHQTRLSEELRQEKRKKMKMIFIGISIALAIIILLTVILALTLSGGDDHHDIVVPTHVVNPYKISAVDNSFYGVSSYHLTRNKDITSFSSTYVNETKSNKFIDSVGIYASLVSYSSLRIQIRDTNVSKNSVGDEFLSSDMQKDTLSTYNISEIGFKVDTYTESNDGSKSSFNIRLFDKDTNVEYLNTLDQNFYLMNYYQEMSFIVYSKHLVGLGERAGSFYLSNGTYVIYSNNVDYQFDNGTKSQGGYGQHPFIMMQMNSSNYFGMYLLNANPIEVDIQLYSQKNQSKITIRAMGGMLDFFFFYGPTYQDVIRQYFSVIGKPKMLPYWAHGFFSKSLAYNDTTGTNALTAVQSFKDKNYPLQGLALPVETLSNFENLAYNDIVANIRAIYPDIHFILPFTHFVPNDTSYTIFLNNSQNQSFAVQAINQDLLVKLLLQDSSFSGYCMDPFNPLFGKEFMKPLMAAQSLNYSGFWIDRNFPYVNSSEIENNNKTNTLYDLSFTPGGIILDEMSIPYFSQHKLTANGSTQIYHLNLHGTFGSELALQMTKNLPESEKNKGLVITDSTFPGVGQYGVGHILMKQVPSFDDLSVQLSNMVKFSMFGIPNVGPNLCGYKTYGTTIEQEQCARYFQLSVISPLAFLNNDEITNDQLPSTFDDTYQSSILASLQQRFKYMIYMRTELYKISKYGGSLLKPVPGQFPNATKEDNLTQVMFGSSIKVDFNFKQGETIRTVYFPYGRWVDLNTFDLFKNTQEFSIGKMPSGFSYVNMYQLGKGTIVAMQNTTAHPVSNIQGLKNVPITLSIALDENYQASGQVYIETGVEDELKNEFYEIQVKNKFIAFRQENSGKAVANVTQIEQIIVSFEEIVMPNFACALKKDLKTVQKLYVTMLGSPTLQFVIQPNNPNDTSDESIMNINDIAYIFYSNTSDDSTLTCSMDTFSLKIEQEITNTSYQYYAQLSSNMTKLYPNDNIPTQYLNVTLLSDNSIYISISPKNYYEIPTQIYDRNFSSYSSLEKTINLTQIMTINQDPFYLEIRNPENETEILFTTKDQLLIQHEVLNILNIENTVSNQDRFFGIGERRGEFFLQDQHTYALYNNPNNADKSYQVGRVVEYSKNGFYPIIYSQMQNNNLLAMILFSGIGQEISFAKQTTNPRLTFQHGGKQQEMVLIFNLTAVKTVETVHKHIQLGSIHETKSKAKLPPPEWALGTNVVYDGKSSPVEFINDYYSTTKWPLDGIVINENSLDKHTSLTFNTTIFNSTTLASLKELGIGIYQIQKSGFSSGSKYQQYIKNNKIYLKDNDNQIYYGYDETGKLMYVDYTDENSETLVKNMMSDFQKTYQKFGVQQQNNEISRKYCKSGTSCIPDNDNEFMDIFKRPGSVQQNMNTPGNAKLSLGSEETLHNFDSLIEHMQWDDALNNNSIPLISDSSAMGAGQLGFVGKSMNYYQPSMQKIAYSMQDIQRMSILGMPYVGALYSDSGSLAEKYAEQIININTFSTLSFMNLYPNEFKSINSTYYEELAYISKYRYVMMKYIRTELFRQINYGTPFIRPLFFDNPDSSYSYSRLTQQYQFGESFYMSFNLSSQMYVGTQAYCTLSYYYGDSKRYSGCTTQTTPMDMITYELGNPLRLVDNTITPLQNILYNSTFKGTQDFDKYPIDLHIMSHNNTNTLTDGYLLIDSTKNYKGTDYCYIQMIYEHTLKTVYFEEIAKTKFGASGNCKYDGFYLGKIYFYVADSSSETQYTAATLNTASKEYTMTYTQTSTSTLFGTFEVQNQKIHISEITNIKFS